MKKRKSQSNDGVRKEKERLTAVSQANEQRKINKNQDHIKLAHDLTIIEIQLFLIKHWFLWTNDFFTILLSSGNDWNPIDYNENESVLSTCDFLVNRDILKEMLNPMISSCSRANTRLDETAMKMYEIHCCYDFMNCVLDIYELSWESSVYYLFNLSWSFSSFLLDFKLFQSLLSKRRKWCNK